MTVWGSESGLTFSKSGPFSIICTILFIQMYLFSHKLPMIAFLKRSESFSWDIIIYSDLLLSCVKGPYMLKKKLMEYTISAALADVVRS